MPPMSEIKDPAHAPDVAQELAQDIAGYQHDQDQFMGELNPGAVTTVQRDLACIAEYLKSAVHKRNPFGSAVPVRVFDDMLEAVRGAPEHGEARLEEIVRAHAEKSSPKVRRALDRDHRHLVRIWRYGRAVKAQKPAPHPVATTVV